MDLGGDFSSPSFIKLRSAFERSLAAGNYSFKLSRAEMTAHSPLEESILDSYRAVACWLDFDMPALNELICKALGRAAIEAASREGGYAQAHMKLIARLLAFRLQNPSLYLLPQECKPARPICVIGDSHALGLAGRVIQWDGIRRIDHVRPLRGVKMFHLASGVPELYRDLMQLALQTVPEGCDLFLSIGEIDCRPNEGVFLAAAKQGRRLRDLIQETVAGFAEFMKLRLAGCAFNSVTVLGLPTPGYDVKGILKDKNRCMLFAKFVTDMNAAVQAMCHINGWRFLDIYSMCKSRGKDHPASYRIDDYHLSPAIYQEMDRWMLRAN